MGAPRGGNAHFKESVYELYKRESHGFSPSVSHCLDHEVSLQGAGRRVAGADPNDYPAGVQGTGRPDRLRRFVISICSWKSRRISPSATSCGASRDAHRIKASPQPNAQITSETQATLQQKRKDSIACGRQSCNDPAQDSHRNPVSVTSERPAGLTRNAEASTS
jgi:hypothetical protein